MEHQLLQPNLQSGPSTSNAYHNLCTMQWEQTAPLKVRWIEADHPWLISRQSHRGVSKEITLFSWSHWQLLQLVWVGNHKKPSSPKYVTVDGKRSISVLPEGCHLFLSQHAWYLRELCVIWPLSSAYRLIHWFWKYLVSSFWKTSIWPNLAVYTVLSGVSRLWEDRLFSSTNIQATSGILLLLLYIPENLCLAFLPSYFLL